MRGIPWKAVKQNTTVKGTTFKANAIDKPSENCQWSTAMVALDGNSAGMQAYYNSIFELSNLFFDWLKSKALVNPTS